MSNPLLTLNNGTKIPQIGFGTWKVGNDQCSEMIYEAIKAGYRLFDGAADYYNEVEVGRGIKKAIDEGVCKREDLVVVSKLWNTFHAKENVKKALKRTLSDLGLEYLDIYYMHFPLAQKYVPIEEVYPPHFYCGDGDKFILEEVSVFETYAALEECVDEGLIKTIGISNFQGILIQELLKICRIKPAVLQIEHHPYLVQERLVEYAQMKGIVVTAYSSFGPQSFLELNNKDAIGAVNLFEHETITSIAKKYDQSPAAVLLRWATQRGLAIIPKSNKVERLKANLLVNSFSMTDDELAAIASLNRNLRFNDPWDWAKIPTFV
ncbi:hypothetical protein KL906_003546 [Ogataea polymorpha]|uniref:NADP-dependent oxidoreductase domain-containing protein n=1 Tax=Ogataea polymorpha TaxID=460523 RepID=A0A9P8NT40_9ASCO|nr:hypothetical protein KL906_003546 [Ogataea polymorpha]KAG7916712.1 hypothetical protein KL927_003351 [Ogataea polymorpha]KAH3659065.1 hypothetical protein OGATHE_006791 [Ogataea polymorpha]